MFRFANDATLPCNCVDEGIEIILTTKFFILNS